MAHRNATCPLCRKGGQTVYRVVDGFTYHECGDCDFIYVDPGIDRKVDSGIPLRQYDDGYWDMELQSARERSWGASLARVAEVLLYSRIPVERFVDIGTGPGYLLDALSWAMPLSRTVFFGVELFPPKSGERTTHPNYVVGSLATAGRTFQGGCCIEVIEHLTPKMMKALAVQIAASSTPGACYIFNTGLTDYVRHEDPGYIDPLRRGHISIWSVKAARLVFKPPKFQVHAIAGKTWAFLVEVKDGSGPTHESVVDRIWSPCQENVRILKDTQTGSVMYVLGIDTARAYR